MRELIEGGRRMGRVAVALTVLLLASAAGAAPASAALNHEALFRFGKRFGSEPGQAGALQASEGIVATSNDGRIFVGGLGENNRIDEFSPWGEFLTAFGWDVAPGAVNELQEVRVRASGGSYRLSFEGASTAPLPFDAGVEEVQSALNGLAKIGGVGGSVSVEARPGLPDGTIPYVYRITFHGSLGGKDVEPIGATSELSAGGEVEAETIADGTAGGTGLEHCTAESGCKSGAAGGGAGQMKSVFGLAIDAGNDIYARDVENRRVDKFSPEGRFILTFGGNVNKTAVEEARPQAERNLCPAPGHPADECQAGTAGTGNGQFAGGFGLGVIGTTVYVGDAERIQEFSLAGEYLGDLPDPEGVLKERTVRWMAADPKKGRLYVVLNKGGVNLEGVHVLDASSGQQLAERPVKRPANVAADEAGDLFALETAGSGAEGKRPQHVAELGPGGEQLIPDAAEEEECAKVETNGTCALFAAPEAGFAIAEFALGTSPAGELFVTNVGHSGTEEVHYIQAYGPAPLSFEAPPPEPPSIDAQYATSVSDTEAQLQAQINPHFFAGTLGRTTYFVQYGTAACIEGGGWEAPCVKEKPSPPGATLKAGIVDEDVGAPVALAGLLPRTSYRYRFVAEGSGRPGVQIVGAGGEEGVEGSDASFRTHAAPGEEAQGPCPANEAFRGGPSAALADCRAYEMVSPVDKEGGEIRVLGETLTNLPAVLSQSAGDGNALAYGSYKSFGGAESSLYTTQYIATRGPGGWSSRAISPPQSTQIIATLGTFDTPYKSFNENLCEGWLGTFGDPPLAAGAVAGYPNLYRRDLCGAGGYEALTQTTPAGVEGPLYLLELQGLSREGATAIYTASGKLTKNAPQLGAGHPLLYAFRRGEAEPRFVCILPGGTPSTQACGAGGPVDTAPKQRLVRLEHAISEDGKRIFFTAGDQAIYLRENPFGEGSECSGEGAPCTIAVSRKGEEDSGAKGAGAQYWGAASDGSRAIFTVRKEGISDLYEFDVAANKARKIAGKVAGVVGMSADAGRIYLVSEEDLTGGQKNNLGEEAAGGQPNLYLRDGGEGGANMRFVGRLASADVGTTSGTSPVALEPWLHSAQVSADGEEAAFMSTAGIGGYDNRDVASGQPDREVYLYRAAAGGGEGRLICASCNPTGQRPAGVNLGGSSAFWVAAQIPVAENDLHEARLIADGGKRLFFETTDALALGDTNGAKDVYEWEEAGTGSCREGAGSYVPAAEGCVSLVSSGKSSVASEFVEASPDGANAFFSTLSSLVPQDPGVTDVYDAREFGGLPSRAPEAPECEGEACQRPPGAPAYETPSSSTYSGPGNVPAKPRRACPKSKVRRGGHCVKKHSSKHRKHHRGHGK